jgi:Zn-finger nucleic acid-binding protein
MKCPVCSNPLVAYDSGSFHVDICRDGCSGIWLDASELERIDESHEPFPKELLKIRKIANVVIDRNKVRICPKCPENVSMHRVVVDPEIRFELDECPQCKGDWLDIGELGNLRDKHEFESQLSLRLKAQQEKIERQIESIDAQFRVNKVASLFKKILGG